MRALSLCRAVARQAARSVASAPAQRVSRSVASLVPAAALGGPLAGGRFAQAPPAPAAPRRCVATAAVPTSSCADVAKKVTVDGTHAYLDVRTPQEFQGGRVPGAVNVPIWLPGPGGMTPNPDFVAQVKAEFPDPEVDLCVGCKAGTRSKAAAAALAGAGYSRLVDMPGGFDAWTAEGLPVER